MNRIILIGNGFDLAHGFKTSYKDFLEWFQLDILKNHDSRGFFRQVTTAQADFYAGTNELKSGYFFKTHNSEKFKTLESFITKYKGCTFIYKNDFLKHIINKQNLENWVDIEEEYYSELNKCLNDKRDGMVEKLNKEFAEVKKYLEEYLKGEVLKKIDYNPKILANIYSISPDDKSEEVLNKYQDDNFLFLNFNYTHTENTYIQKNPYHQRDPINIKTDIIHIHGELDKPDNPIIFGYGDDTDDKYKLIEGKNKKEYLENIKPIRYPETGNYKRLLKFIDSKEYEIRIMGHSCGISDRTLLNTLFEHKNCQSIKVFYHKKADDTDNFSDVVRNISRNFTNKPLMRKILVDKTESCSLS